ncbi:NAD-P-binding protein [Artomyces pyxidatus]|uniref:NAD-P-binding protein n=1 Tax=Artomyces pyxidatus TaxID=48021 RepID=A0ACB8T819_9AGAM|nr:NAD-P-binding protein [Artomyces pyxidatus]
MGLLVMSSAGFLLTFLAFYLYVRLNDAKLMRLPPEVEATFSPHRVTPQDAREAAERLEKEPITIGEHLPPRTGRRYIVVGGAGFLGGWIVCHLLERGEDPKNIRVLDIRAPTRPDLTTGRAQSVDFLQVDISDKAAVDAAFQAPWPGGNTSSGITVFHTVAVFRFYENHPALLPLSDKVNVQGTQHIIDASRAAGVSVLVFTSSGSICVRRTRLWLWPWEKQPEFFVQVITDDDNIIPKRHEHFFSNYAASKIKGERLVRAADNTPSGAGILRTGCLRPGNGIFGPGGDILCGSYLVRQTNPTWVSNTLQNFAYVENVSLAHLCYEQRLLETLAGSPDPDLGGQAFGITDAGPPVTYGDVYCVLNTLTDGRTVFHTLSATAMLLLAHIFALLHLARTRLRLAGSPLAALVPALNADLVNLQPPIFALTQVHLVWDDARARVPPEQGGLGYAPPWTTVAGLCKLVEEHERAGGKAEARSLGGGISLGFAANRAGKGVERVIEGLALDPTAVRN